MKTLAVSLSVLVLTLGVGMARAQDVLEDARLAPVRAQLTEAVDAAEADDLPAEWLRQKIAEGLSKRVPPAVIVRATRALLERMRTADTMLRPVAARPSSRHRLLRAGVDALAAGAPARQTAALVRRVASDDPPRAGERVREVLEAVAELGERHFSGRAAIDAVTRAYARDRGTGIAAMMSAARQIRGGDRDGALERVGRGRAVDPGRGRVDHGRDVGRGGPRH